MGWAETYSTVFAPELMVIVGLVGLAAIESSVHDGTRRAAVERVVTILFGATIAIGITLVTPELLDGASAGDLQASLALIVGLGAIAAIWRHRDWGERVLWACAAIVAVAAIHAAIVPFWNLSGHVAFSAVPLGLVALADRRFVWVALVPIGMMPARVGTGVHTPPEVIAGLGLAVLILAIVARARPEFRQSWPTALGESGAVDRS
ncbi:MAG: hypothetical protein ABEJ86_04280 [Halococcoides sp.]